MSRLLTRFSSLTLRTSKVMEHRKQLHRIINLTPLTGVRFPSPLAERGLRGEVNCLLRVCLHFSMRNAAGSHRHALQQFTIRVRVSSVTLSTRHWSYSVAPARWQVAPNCKSCRSLA